MPKIDGHGQAAILSNRDYEKVFKQISNPSHRLIVWIARYTGERWGAIVQLKVKDVYSSTGEVLDHITFRKNTRKGKDATRQVVMNDSLREKFSAFKPAPDSVWLFPGRDRQTHLTFRAASAFFTEALERAGLEGYSTHSTRRTFITQLANNGVGPRTIQEITGHKDLASLQRYIEVNEAQVKNAINSL